jgi:drug/metabolite transporter (DMT)-like permease
MVGSITAFTAMAIATRAVQDRHDTFEILAWRSLIGVGLVLAFGALTGQWRAISATRLPAHAGRNLCHFTGQALWFWAVTQIPLAQVFALEFTSPIWVLLLSPLFLGERLTRRKLVAAALGFTGVLVVARPDFAAPEPGVLAAAACAIFFAGSVIMTKRLTGRGEAVISILFWLTLFQTGFGFGLALADGAAAWPDARTLPWLVLIGVAGVTAHLCLTTALSLAPATVVVPVDFARLPVIAVVGALAYGEPLEIAVLAGGLMILAANLMNLAPADTTARHNSVTRRH